MTCPLCGNSAVASAVASPSGGVSTWERFACEVCGEYDITYLARQAVKGYDEHRRFALAAAARHACDRDQVLRLAIENIQAVVNSVPKPSRNEQANLLLQYIEQNEGPSRTPVRVVAHLEFPVVYATPRGLWHVLNGLAQQQLIERDDTSDEPRFLLAFKAHERLDEWRREKATPDGSAGWPRVDAELALTRRHLAEAKVEADFQAVGHRCRELFLSVAQAAFDPSQHSAPGVSSGDAEGLLAAFFATEMHGGQHEQARAMAKKVEAFAGSVAHDRTPTFQEAALAVEAVSFVAKVVSIISGRRDRG